MSLPFLASDTGLAVALAVSHTERGHVDGCLLAPGPYFDLVHLFIAWSSLKRAKYLRGFCQLTSSDSSSVKMDRGQVCLIDCFFFSRIIELGY